MARRRGAGGGRVGAFRWLERTGVNRGVFGTSRGWLYLGAGLWTARKVRELGERRSEVLISEELRPGQRLIIANGRATLDEPGRTVGAPSAESRARRGRRARRRARRAERNQS